MTGEVPLLLAFLLRQRKKISTEMIATITTAPPTAPPTITAVFFVPDFDSAGGLGEGDGDGDALFPPSPVYACA